VGTQYRSGIYFYSPEQEEIAKASMAAEEQRLGRKLATELKPAKRVVPRGRVPPAVPGQGGAHGAAAVR